MAVYPVRIFPDEETIYNLSGNMLKIWGSIDSWMSVDELFLKMRIPSEEFFPDLLGLAAMGLVRMAAEPFWGLGLGAEGKCGKEVRRQKRCGLYRGVEVVDY